MHDAQLKFYTLVDYMVSFNKEMRNTLPVSTAENLSIPMFVREFCTIHCNIGRRSGKTQYIIDRARSDDLIIVHNEMIASMYKKFGVNTNIMTASSVSRLEEVFRGYYIPKFNNIYIDEPRLCAEYVSMHYIYKSLIHSTKQTVLMLGT